MQDRYTISVEDSLFQVTDTFGNVLGVADTRIQARELLRELNKPVKAVLHIEGTRYGCDKQKPDDMPDAEPVDAFVAPVKPTAKVVRMAVEGKPVSKAIRCREFIAGIKKNGGTKEEVIAFNMEVLGMKKALAKVYMEENWVRV